MKRLLMVCALLLGVTMAKAQDVSILDFCYLSYNEYDESYYLTTYPVNDCLGNLVDRGFGVVSAERQRYVGAGNAEYEASERVLRKRSASGAYITVVLFDVPDCIRFDSERDFRLFLKDVLTSGYFVKGEDGYYNCVGAYCSGVDLDGLVVHPDTREIYFDIWMP